MVKYLRVVQTIAVSGVPTLFFLAYTPVTHDLYVTTGFNQLVLVVPT